MSSTQAAENAIKNPFASKMAPTTVASSSGKFQWEPSKPAPMTLAQLSSQGGNRSNTLPSIQPQANPLFGANPNQSMYGQPSGGFGQTSFGNTQQQTAPLFGAPNPYGPGAQGGFPVQGQQQGSNQQQQQQYNGQQGPPGYSSGSNLF